MVLSLVTYIPILHCLGRPKKLNLTKMQRTWGQWCFIPCTLDCAFLDNPCIIGEDLARLL